MPVIPEVYTDLMGMAPVKYPIGAIWGLRSLCWYCGAFCYGTRDHFYPKSKGGTFRVWSCKRCQKNKKDLTPEEWVQRIKRFKSYTPQQKVRMINATEALINFLPDEYKL